MGTKLLKNGKLWCIVYKKRSEGRWFNGIYYFYAGILVDAGNMLVEVCDIKNLKRKLRPDEEHKDNSPWNIAADFDIDMSFSPVQIREMLESYEADHKTGMDIEDMAQEIYAYTSGYPYLVSRLCQLLDNQIASSSVKGAWSRNNLLEAVRNLVKESNSLVLYQK